MTAVTCLWGEVWLVQEPIRDLALANSVDDAFLRRTIKVALHVRRYLPFYVFGTIWVLTLAAFPIVRSSDDGPPSGVATSTGGLATDTAPTADVGVVAADTPAAAAATAAGPMAAGLPASARAAASSRAAGSTKAAGATTGKVDAGVAALAAAGKMRDGRACSDGVRQIEISTYAMQCTPAFAGDNRGATAWGVTGDKIRIVRREFPDSANSEAVAAVTKQAGFADEATTKAVRDVFLGYFQKHYELYGRQIEFIDYESQNGDSTEEAQSRGREGACADATHIKQELKAFAVVGSSGVFGECAAEREMLVFQTGAYFPEAWFKARHPYAWGVLTECERISYQVGEYVGKRLVDRPAKFAGDAAFQNLKRKFGVYVPDNDEYQHCVNIYKSEAAKYGAPKPEQYNYQLDVSRFPDQAAQGAVQFKAAGVTTLVLACDPISVIALSQAATKQAWFPEWYIIGVAAQDTDNLARLYDQTAVDGHLFGMSQLGATQKLIGPTSEPGRLYKKITGNEIPAGTTGAYFEYVQVLNMLQAAGPVLNVQTIAAGARTIIPGGAPEFAAGYWSYQDGPDGKPGAGDHTMIDDSREVYWVCNGPSGGCTYPAPDGKNGTFLETYNGKRFRNGEWPKEEPPVYPKS